MKTLIEWLKLWTSGHECPDCSEAVKMLEDVLSCRDDTVHTFQIRIACHKGCSREIHISHISHQD
jgi:hypothetical protein